MDEFLPRLLFLVGLCPWATAPAQNTDLESEDFDKEIAAIEKELMEEISVWDYSTDLRLSLIHI